MNRSVSIHGKPFTVAADPQDFWGWIDTGIWEPGTFAIFDHYLTPETNFIDVGAWIGPTALYASRLARHVWALEPDPVAWEILKSNLALNPDITNVECFNEAIMDREGTVRMGAAGLGCSVTRLSCHENEIEVPCTTLSAFIAKHRIPDPLFIKMDVEGAEALILKDLAFFQERKPDLYVSTHRMWWAENNWNADEAMEVIRKVGRLYRHKICWHNEQLYAENIDCPFSDILFTDRSL